MNPDCFVEIPRKRSMLLAIPSRLNTTDVATLALVTQEWNTALALQGSEHSLMRLHHKGKILMGMEVILKKDRVIRTRYFKLPPTGLKSNENS